MRPAPMLSVRTRTSGLRRSNSRMTASVPFVSGPSPRPHTMSSRFFVVSDGASGFARVRHGSAQTSASRELHRPSIFFIFLIVWYALAEGRIRIHGCSCPRQRKEPHQSNVSNQTSEQPVCRFGVGSPAGYPTPWQVEGALSTEAERRGLSADGGTDSWGESRLKSGRVVLGPNPTANLVCPMQGPGSPPGGG